MPSKSKIADDVSREDDYADGVAKDDKNDPFHRRYKKETGMGKTLLHSIIKRHKGDPHRQVAEFCESFQIPAGTGRERVASLGTHKAYRERLTILVRKLKDMNMPINNLNEVSARQVRRFFEQMEKDGWSASRMANVNTTVRRFGNWMGKPDLCPALSTLVDVPSSAIRQQTAVTPADWEQCGVDAENAICMIQTSCPITALQLRLARAFGVRVQEFLMFKPLHAQRAEGFIYIMDGAKGGRPRLVPIETDEQRALLLQATEIAKTHPKGLVMTKSWRKLDQAKNHFYYQLWKAGITKKVFGVTAHGLRHAYACKIYHQLTGEPAPVMGGGLVDAELDTSARLEIAERLGHGRKNVTSAYLGSHRVLSKVKRQNLEKMTAVLEGDRLLKEIASTAGFDGFFVVGPAADGNQVPKGQMMNFAYRAMKRFDETQVQADGRVAKDAMDMALRAGQLLEVQVAAIPMSNVGDGVPQYELIGITRKSSSQGKASGAGDSNMATGG